ncbi:MAG: hypothetical protein ACFFBD_12260 [Candidatus Hodarchaeota archaeon]
MLFTLCVQFWGTILYLVDFTMWLLVWATALIDLLHFAQFIRILGSIGKDSNFGLSLESYANLFEGERFDEAAIRDQNTILKSSISRFKRRTRPISSFLIVLALTVFLLLILFNIGASPNIFNPPPLAHGTLWLLTSILFTVLGLRGAFFDFLYPQYSLRNFINYHKQKRIDLFVNRV